MVAMKTNKSCFHCQIVGKYLNFDEFQYKNYLHKAIMAFIGLMSIHLHLPMMSS